MSIVTLNDTNYSGYSADITFNAYTGGSVSLGTHIIPYTFTSGYYYGTYDLYYSQFNKTCSIYIPEPPSLIFSTYFADALGEGNTIGFYISGDSVFDMTVDWGNGVVDNFNGNNVYTPNTLTDASGSYLIKVTTSDNATIKKLSFSNPYITCVNSDLVNLETFTSLEIIENVGVPVETYWAGFSVNQIFPSSLKNLSILASNLVSFNPPLNQYPDGLESLTIIQGGYYDIQSNFQPTNPLPTSLQTLSLGGGQWLNFYPQYPLPSGLVNLNLGGNWLTPSNIEDILVHYTAQTFTSVGTLNLRPEYTQDFNFNTVCIPNSGTGYQSYLSLTANGWTVNVDVCPDYGEPILLTFDNQINPYKYFTIYNTSNVNFYMKIDWGDGTVEYYNNSNIFYPYHYYVNSDTYVASVSFNNNSLINLIDISTNYTYNYLTDISGLEILDSLIDLDLSNNLLTSFAPTLPLPSSITYLNLDGNLLTSDEINNTFVYLSGNTWVGSSKYFYIRNETECFEPTTIGQEAIDYLTLTLGNYTFTTNCPPVLKFTVNYDGGNIINFYIAFNYGSNLTIDWGDGNIQNIFISGGYISHNYGGAGIGDYNVSISGDSGFNYLYYLAISNDYGDNRVISIENLDKFIYLQYLILNGNLLTSFNIKLPNSIFLMYLYSNQITSFNPTYPLPNSLGTLLLNNNLLTSFSPTMALPNSLATLQLDYNLLTSTEIGNTISYLKNNTISDLSTIYLDNQVGGGCLINPSQSYDDYLILLSQSRYVAVNVCP